MKNEDKKIFNVDTDLEKSISVIVDLFHSGKLFIYPTDTIYGIGGNPFDKNVVERINSIKERNEQKQFIWLISDLKNLLNYIELKFEKHLEFLENIWPAPVSVVLSLNCRTKSIIGFDTIAFRIPANDFCLKVLKETKLPVISTSVNRSNQKTLTEPSEIIMEFGKEVDSIFFTSRSVEKSASTIIDLTGKQPKLIRDGAIKFVELLEKFN
jgi:L-threonylcarbamoyladenylate synthase